MTDDELEAIKQRFNAIKQRFNARGRYIPDSHITVLRLIAEIERLRAKPSENLDDAEPVTEERLVAMLGPMRQLEMGCGFSITFYVNAVPKLTVSQGRVSGYGSWIFEHKINLPKCETMADVRRLIAALKGE